MWLLHCTHNKPLSDWQNQYLAIALPCAHSGASVCSPRHASQFHKHNVRRPEKGPAFWLMSPWQLHNSWIVLAIYLSFANHNLGCVFEKGQEKQSYALRYTHHPPQKIALLTETLTFSCPNLGGWELRVLWEGRFSFMMNSQLCAFGQLHANSPVFICPCVCLLTEAWPALHWHHLVQQWKRNLIKALMQLICHLING